MDLFLVHQYIMPVLPEQSHPSWTDSFTLEKVFNINLVQQL